VALHTLSNRADSAALAPLLYDRLTISGRRLVGTREVRLAGEVTGGCCATGARESGQARAGAAFIGIAGVPQIAWPSPQPPGAGRSAATVRRVKVHLVDGTYELFRQHFGAMNRRGDSPRDPGPFDATIGVLTSTLQLVEDGATHVGVASDHVIESFRNDLWPGYKTSAGMPPELLAQIPVMEDALVAMGVTTW